MFRNYLAAAGRNLRRNKVHAVVTIVGLAIGFTSALLIALIIRSELTHDGFLPNHERIYRISSVQRIAGQGDLYVDTARPNVAYWLKSEFPAIENTARLSSRSYPLRRGETEGIEKIYWADPSTFDVLPFPAIAGDPRSALDKPDGLVLTRRLARKYFGRDDPIGETLEIDRRHLMQVTAVIEDLPGNTHFDTEIFASGLAQFSRLTELDAIAAANQYPSVYTYIRLQEGAATDGLFGDLSALIDKHVPSTDQPASKTMGLQVLPITRVHLTPAGRSAMKASGSVSALIALASVGILIVIAAVTNFVNLMTARAATRSAEVGVRKAFGAQRRDLIVQFIGESMIYVALALLLALALVGLLKPTLNVLLERDAPFEFWTDPLLLIGTIVSAIVIGGLAGAYPALVLSAFQPTVILRAGPSGGAGSGFVRQGLVIVQSTILIGLIVGTAVIYAQTNYAMTEGMRLEKDLVLLIETSIEKPCNAALKEEIRRHNNVSAAACSFMAPFANGISNSARTQDGASVMLFASPVDFEFFDVYGLNPLVGRLFSTQRADSAVARRSGFAAPLILNETAVRKLGFASNQAAIEQTVRWRRLLSLNGKFGEEQPSEIIGVVPDFPMGTVHGRIEPTAYYVDPTLAQFIHVKLRSGEDVFKTLHDMDALWAMLGDARPIARYFVDEQLQRMYVSIIRQGKIFTAFALVALFIACLGLYGLSAFSAERRKKEIGIRKALGAGRMDVVRLLLWQFTRPVVLANLIAWPLAYFAARRWLDGFAYHVDLSLWIFVAAGLMAWAIACATVAGHALRAASVRPAAVLRCE